MSTHKKLMTACCAAVLALGLAACGSSSDDANGNGGDNGTPPPMAHVCDAGASQACVDARQAELEAIEADEDATVGALKAARMAVADAQTALDDANTAAAEEMTVSGLIGDAMTLAAGIAFEEDGDENSTPAEVAAARDALDAAQESLDGMANLSDDTEMALQARIDAIETSFAPIEVAVNVAAATAAAATKRVAIAAEAAVAIADRRGSGRLGCAGH